MNTKVTHSRWWFDLTCPISFKIFDSSSVYDENYFKSGHPSQDDFKFLAENITSRAKEIKKDIKTVLDFGCATCNFMLELDKLGFDINGTDSCSKNLMLKEYTDRVFQKDFKRPFDLEKKFDLIISMEIAEHIECPFSSVYVENITKHGDLVYLSACPPDINKPHFHHPNEQPMEFWENIFLYFDFIRIGEIKNGSNRREDGVFFARKGTTNE
jgi:hypothetical protein